MFPNELSVVTFIEEFLLYHGFPYNKVNEIMIEYHKERLGEILQQIDIIFEEYIPEEEDGII